ncbi:DUF2306 domain-containing protein [Pontibacter sp. G13]|uniref:DUF2306 domain-containing protein n=1 Tax=Pontibacter sp. G13 TaxID=3074898 RepID=UPI00288B4F9A|nr:DUF2306 domain-containing protein [Pontibacter sp. G13]WNJ18191.1 DUF2306 domain-containing protein [Pontibacter sp. G13]
MSLARNIGWWVFAVLCVMVGLYPLAYLFMDTSMGLLGTKSAELLQQTLWNVAFYVHISLGGLALLVGWTQFHEGFRTKRLQLHRKIGLVYGLSVALSGIASLYIGWFATGGWVSQVGFMALGLVWLFTTAKAWMAIREREIRQHQVWMTYSYAACSAAVTLRLWMPILIPLMGEFIPAYRIIAWLSWVPNLLVAAWIVKRQADRQPVVA